MSFDVPKPDEPTIRVALSAHLPHLANEDIAALGTGWTFWAFRAADTVLRFPRYPGSARTLHVEAAILREMAPTLPLPVPVIEVQSGGPNALPFTSHGLIPGVSVVDLEHSLAAGSGTVLGRFVRAMHRFPLERAVELGLEYMTPDDRRRALREMLEDRLARDVLPLVSNEAQAHVTSTFEQFINDRSNFAWTPVVSHSDLDDWNVLADPASGNLTGVIDWGDLAMSDPARDFTTALYGGFIPKGLLVSDLLNGYGMEEAEMLAMRPRCSFAAYCWPLHEIIYGLDSRQNGVVEKGIQLLYETVGKGAI